MSDSPTFKVQTDLGNYCRTGTQAPASSIDKNLEQYRHLVFNVIQDALTKAYPLTKELIGNEKWNALVEQFIATHRCQSPQIWKLPYELYEFVEQGNTNLQEAFEFIKELMHYEWLEIEIFMMEDEFIPNFQTQGDLKKDIFIANPETRILALSYPIHLKKVKAVTTTDKAQYFVTIHRDYYSKKVKFNDLSYPFVELLLKIHEAETTFTDLEYLLTKHEKDTSKNQKRILTFLNFAVENNLILGFKK